MTSDDDAVALRLAGDAIAIGEMDASGRLVHQSVDSLAGTSDQVRMERIADLHRHGSGRSLQFQQKN